MKIDRELEQQKIETMFVECHRELVNLGIPVTEITNISLKFRQNMKRRALCLYLKNHTYEIILPTRCFQEVGDKIETRRLLYHELVHTCPNCMNHNKGFLSFRRTIKNKLNIDILGGYDDPASVHLPEIYSCYCPTCDSLTSHRRPSAKNLNRKTEFMQLYKQGGYTQCGTCGRKFTLQDYRFSEKCH